MGLWKQCGPHDAYMHDWLVKGIVNSLTHQGIDIILLPILIMSQDSDNATVFIMRTEEDKLQADSRFELEYLSASDERHAIRAVREDVFGANSCAPYNLAAVPLSIQGDGSGQANETMEALESSLYYQISGVIREPQCN